LIAQLFAINRLSILSSTCSRCTPWRGPAVGGIGANGPAPFATRTTRTSHPTLVPVPDRILNGCAINCFFSLSPAIFVRSPINLYQIAHRLEYFDFAIFAWIGDSDHSGLRRAALHISHLASERSWPIHSLWPVSYRIPTRLQVGAFAAGFLMTCLTALELEGVCLDDI